MKIRKLPIPLGFNKNKLKIAFAIFVIILGAVLFWALRNNPVGDNGKVKQQKVNYASTVDNTGADIEDILNSGARRKVTASGTTILAGEKMQSSSVEAQRQVVANQQAEVQAANELKQAMKAPIIQLTPQSSNNQAGGSGQSGNSQTASSNPDQDGLPKDDQSMTSEKRNFMKSQEADLSSNVMTGTLNNPVAALVLAMGTKIPAQLDQEINSDLPGQIYGHVSRDVFDSRTHSMLLIPAGSNLVGTYDSALAYGQERLLVAWKRINFPNGQWIDIKGMGGADPVGAGFGDQVDNHYWRIFGATFLTSVLAAGAQLSQPQQTNALQAPGTGQIIGQSVGTQIAQTGTMLLQKNINIQPTLHIRAGFEFTVEVNKDIVFPNAYTANGNKN